MQPVSVVGALERWREFMLARGKAPIAPARRRKRKRRRDAAVANWAEGHRAPPAGSIAGDDQSV